MPGITVMVDATVGSPIGRRDSLTSEPAGRVRPVGKGCLPATRGDDGRPIEALVPMRAGPGVCVRTMPVAVLHLAAQARRTDEVLCVAEDLSLADLVTAPDPMHWQREPDAWATALARLAPQPVGEVTGRGSREDAEEPIARARHAYVRLTGCLV